MGVPLLAFWLHDGEGIEIARGFEIRPEESCALGEVVGVLGHQFGLMLSPSQTHFWGAMQRLEV